HISIRGPLQIERIGRNDLNRPWPLRIGELYEKDGPAEPPSHRHCAGATSGRAWAMADVFRDHIVGVAPVDFDLLERDFANAIHAVGIQSIRPLPSQRFKA